MKRKLRKAESHETHRSEFFSDGVFAVAITLLALDLVQIHASDEAGYSTLWSALRHFWPVLLAFAASFASIGAAWINHHAVFARADRVSRSVNTANLGLLACVVMFPWATATLAEALSNGGGTQEVLLYAAVLFLNAAAWFILLSLLSRHPELLNDPADARRFAQDRILALAGIGAAVVGGLVGQWSPIGGTVLFLAMPIFYSFFSAGFELSGDA